MSTPKKTASSINANQLILGEACSFNEVLKVMMPQWKMQVLFCINDGINRFSLIREHHPTLSDQTLSKRLKELVDEDFIEKEIDRSTVPVTITYHINPKARELIVLIPAMCRWSERWLDNECV